MNVRNILNIILIIAFFSVTLTSCGGDGGGSGGTGSNNTAKWDEAKWDEDVWGD